MSEFQGDFFSKILSIQFDKFKIVSTSIGEKNEKLILKLIFFRIYFSLTLKICHFYRMCLLSEFSADLFKNKMFC